MSCRTKNKDVYEGIFFFWNRNPPHAPLWLGVISFHVLLDGSFSPHIFTTAHFWPLIFPAIFSKTQWLRICYVCAETNWICTRKHIVTKWITRRRRHYAQSPASLDSVIAPADCVFPLRWGPSSRSACNYFSVQRVSRVITSGVKLGEVVGVGDVALGTWTWSWTTHHFLLFLSQTQRHLHCVWLSLGLNKLCKDSANSAMTQ